MTGSSSACILNNVQSTRDGELIGFCVTRLEEAPVWGPFPFVVQCSRHIHYHQDMTKCCIGFLVRFVPKDPYAIIRVEGSWGEHTKSFLVTFAPRSPHCYNDIGNVRRTFNYRGRDLGSVGKPELRFCGSQSGRTRKPPGRYPWGLRVICLPVQLVSVHFPRSLVPQATQL